MSEEYEKIMCDCKQGDVCPQGREGYDTRCVINKLRRTRPREVANSPVGNFADGPKIGAFPVWYAHEGELRCAIVGPDETIEGKIQEVESLNAENDTCPDKVDVTFRDESGATHTVRVEHPDKACERLLGKMGEAMNVPDNLEWEEDRPPQKEFDGFEHTGEWREPKKGEWFQGGDGDFHVSYVDPYGAGPRWILRKVEPECCEGPEGNHVVDKHGKYCDYCGETVEPDSKPEMLELKNKDGVGVWEPEGVEVWEVVLDAGSFFARQATGYLTRLSAVDGRKDFIGFLYEHECLKEPEVHNDSQMFAWLGYRGLYASVPLAHIQSGEAVPVRPVGVVMRKGE